jgi:uncharacterized protein
MMQARPSTESTEMTIITSQNTVRIALEILLRRAVTSLRLLVCALLAACAVSSAAACPLEPPKLRVSDSGGLLGEKTSAIAERLAKFQEFSGHQVFLLVIPSLGPSMSIEECAVRLFKQWQLGRKGVDDGVLLLVAVKERTMRIEVGYGLEGTLTDAKSSRIIHEVMAPLFARGEYAEGIDRGLSAIMAVLGGPTTVAPSDPPASASQQAALGQSQKRYLLRYCSCSCS